MNKQLLCIIILIFACSTASFSQNEEKIDGIIIPKTVVFSEKVLKLNGVGIRTKFWSDVYTQALYLTFLSKDSDEIIKSDTKMAMILNITSPLVTAKKFSKSLNNGIKKVLGENNWIKFKPELDLLDATINAEKIVENDIFNLIYNDTDQSIWIIKNGVVKGKIPGFEFKKAFFSIWLSNKPVNEKLKQNLLGITSK